MYQRSVMILLLMAVAEAAATAVSAIQTDLKCSDFDRIFNELTLVSAADRAFPTNNEEFSAYCRKNADLAGQATQLTKTCFNETMKNILSVAIYSYKSRNKSLCKSKNSKRARQFVEAGPCLNQYKSKLAKCIETGARRVGVFRTVVTNNLKFPYMCCESVQFAKCLDRIPTGDCKEKVQVYAEAAQSVMSGFVDRSCGEYNGDTDKCETLKPVKMPAASLGEENSKPSLLKNIAALIASID